MYLLSIPSLNTFPEGDMESLILSISHQSYITLPYLLHSYHVANSTFALWPVLLLFCVEGLPPTIFLPQLSGSSME